MAGIAYDSFAFHSLQRWIASTVEAIVTMAAANSSVKALMELQACMWPIWNLTMLNQLGKILSCSCSYSLL